VGVLVVGAVSVWALVVAVVGAVSVWAVVVAVGGAPVDAFRSVE
jgi:hypothetical protein